MQRDNDDVYGDVPNLPKELIMIDHVREACAKAGLVVTGVTLPTAWLANIDNALRIILSVAGIVAAVYSALYYRKKWKESK